MQKHLNIPNYLFIIVEFCTLSSAKALTWTKLNILINNNQSEQDTELD